MDAPDSSSRTPKVGCLSVNSLAPVVAFYDVMAVALSFLLGLSFERGEVLGLTILLAAPLLMCFIRFTKFFTERFRLCVLAYMWIYWVIIAYCVIELPLLIVKLSRQDPINYVQTGLVAIVWAVILFRIWFQYLLGRWSVILKRDTTDGAVGGSETVAQLPPELDLPPSYELVEETPPPYELAIKIVSNDLRLCKAKQELLSNV